MQAAQSINFCFCRTYFGKLDFPGKKTIPLDSIVCLSNNMIGKLDALGVMLIKNVDQSNNGSRDNDDNVNGEQLYSNIVVNLLCYRVTQFLWNN